MRLSRIKISLYKKGLTQQELASKLGLSEASISRICNGWKLPNEELKTKIAKLLQRKVEFLWPPKREKSGGN